MILEKARGEKGMLKFGSWRHLSTAGRGSVSGVDLDDDSVNIVTSVPSLPHVALMCLVNRLVHRKFSVLIVEIFLRILISYNCNLQAY